MKSSSCDSGKNQSSVVTKGDASTMPQKIKFTKQYKPIGFGDRSDPDTVEGHRNKMIEAAETNMQRFRERVDNLTFVERKPLAKTSNPFTNPEPVLDVDEIMQRIATVKEEKLSLD
jgi:hypothetical protein